MGGSQGVEQRLVGEVSGGNGKDHTICDARDLVEHMLRDHPAARADRVAHVDSVKRQYVHHAFDDDDISGLCGAGDLESEGGALRGDVVVRDRVQIFRLMTGRDRTGGESFELTGGVVDREGNPVSQAITDAAAGRALPDAARIDEGSRPAVRGKTAAHQLARREPGGLSGLEQVISRGCVADAEPSDQRPVGNVGEFSVGGRRLASTDQPLRERVVRELHETLSTLRRKHCVHANTGVGGLEGIP